ncbi:MAG: type II toxin-antitoxin system HicB family antitoxin, partial [Candidatus Hodarchaeota archaeon]
LIYIYVKISYIPFTLEYWIDDKWYGEKLKDWPGVFSQGKNLEELEDNIRDAFHSMIESESFPNVEEIKTKESTH